MRQYFLTWIEIFCFRKLEMINVFYKLLYYVSRQKAHIDRTLPLQSIPRSYLPQKKGRTSHESELTVLSLDAVSNKVKHDTIKRKQTSCIPLKCVLFNITRRLPDTIGVQVFVCNWSFIAVLLFGSVSKSQFHVRTSKLVKSELMVQNQCILLRENPSKRLC
jgi:hypothetical protein